MHRNCKTKISKKEKVHYFNHRPVKKKGNSNVHPFSFKYAPTGYIKIIPNCFCCTKTAVQ